VCLFFFDLGLSTYFFLFNLFLIGHGVTEKSLGQISSAMSIGILVGTLPAARVANWFGLRTAMQISFVVLSTVCVLRATIMNIPIQLLLAFLSGMGFSIWAVCLCPAVAQLSSERARPFAFSLIFSLGIGVGALGGIAGGSLPGWFSHLSGYGETFDSRRLVLLLSSGFVVVGMLPLSKIKFTLAASSAKVRRTFHPFLVRFLPAIAIWSFVTGSFGPFANVYLARHLQMPLYEIGLVFSVSQLAQVVGVLVAPWALRRAGSIAGIAGMQVATSIALLALAITRSSLGGALGYVAFNSFLYMSEPGMYSLLMSKVPVEERSSASAVNALVMSGCQAIAAVLAGWTITKLGYPRMLSLTAGIAILAAGLFWKLLKGESTMQTSRDESEQICTLEQPSA
jgi:predicted MFS family arabinose efflux permease